MTNSLSDDTQKPSRQNRRPKRGWKKTPKKQLTAATWLAHHAAQVLNTPQLALPAHVRQADFLRPLVSQWPGSGQPCNSLRVKAASRLVAVFKYLAAPLNKGRLLNNQLGAIMAKQKRTRAKSRFTLSAYNFTRRFFGPVAAFRVASWRAA